MKVPEELARDIVAVNGCERVCHCDEIYSARGKVDPHCRWCNFGKGMVDDIIKVLCLTRDAALEEAAKEAESWWEIFNFASFSSDDPRRFANPNQIAERIRVLKRVKS